MFTNSAKPGWNAIYIHSNIRFLNGKAPWELAEETEVSGRSRLCFQMYWLRGLTALGISVLGSTEDVGEGVKV